LLGPLALPGIYRFQVVLSLGEMQTELEPGKNWQPSSTLQPQSQSLEFTPRGLGPGATGPCHRAILVLDVGLVEQPRVHHAMEGTRLHCRADALKLRMRPF
jgi:hypothetical protein